MATWELQDPTQSKKNILTNYNIKSKPLQLQFALWFPGNYKNTIVTMQWYKSFLNTRKQSSFGKPARACAHATALNPISLTNQNISKCPFAKKVLNLFSIHGKVMVPVSFLYCRWSGQTPTNLAVRPTGVTSFHCLALYSKMQSFSYAITDPGKQNVNIQTPICWHS